MIVCNLTPNDVLWSSDSEDDFISEMLEDSWDQAKVENNSIENMVINIGKKLARYFDEEVINILWVIDYES